MAKVRAKMFLGYQNNKIKFYTEQPLDETLYNLDRVEETQDEYVLDGDEYVLNDEEQQQKAQQKAIAQRVAELKEELNQLDLKSIRAIRSGDTEYIERYEAEAEELREQIRELENG